MQNKLNRDQNDDSINVDDQFDKNQMNSYNINSGRFKMNSNDQNIENYNNRSYVNSYVNNNNNSNISNTNNDPRLVNNQYYGQNENIVEDDEYLEQNEEYNDETENLNNQKGLFREKQQEIFFQTKIRNTGFWGTVSDIKYFTAKNSICSYIYNRDVKKLT